MVTLPAASQRSASSTPPDPWITLLVLQPSPFCNINCDYCYLPDRSSKVRMPDDVVRASIQRTFAADLVQGPLTIIWHAGEPMAVPVPWYRNAFGIIAETAPSGAKIIHSFQSNGTLINEAWCEFLVGNEVQIGLSVDGPAFLHDAHRRTRQGGGTHAAAMRGLSLLRDAGIPFHVIAVITREALGHAREIFEFFESEGVRRLGFNIEEVEAQNTSSSIDAESGDRVREFYETIFELQSSRKSIVIREFDAALQKIRSGISLRAFDFPWFNEQVRPFGIVSIDHAGRFAMYSPELLGMPVEPYGDFYFGNVLEDDFAEALARSKFLDVLADIKAGIRVCAETCSFYGVCGGGAPANKFYENGSFATGETLFCRYAIQFPMEIVLRDLERTLDEIPGPSATGAIARESE